MHFYIISEKNPEFLYPYWDYFVKYLRSSNHYHKTGAIIIIANLTKIDTEKRFDSLFDEYYENLKSDKTVVPIYLMKVSGRIINYKPYLRDRITNILLNVESIHPGKQIELVKCAVIESFSEFFESVKNKDKLLNFVEKQVNSSSPKTKKTAKEFLKKFMEK